MKAIGFVTGLLGAVSVAMVFAAPVAAKIKDRANSGYCASGKQVTNTKKCKENGGTQ